MLMLRHPQLLLHLAALAALASSLSPQHLSSALFLLPQTAKCAINFGKDITSTYRQTYPPQFFFYDGVRCSSPSSKNASAAFVVGNSQTMTDIIPVVNNLGDVVVLNPKTFQSSTHPNLVRTHQNTVIPCGENAITEILLLAATNDATLRIRDRPLRLVKDFFYAFVDHVPWAEHEQVRNAHQPRLCVFKGGLTRDIVVNAEKGLGADRAGLIAAGVFGVAVLAVIMYGSVFLMYRESVESELSDDTDGLSSQC